MPTLLKTLLTFTIICSAIGLNAQDAPKPPFSRGVNLSGWFERPSTKAIQFSRFGKQDFINIKSLGADVIRLPINLHFMTSGAPEYKIDPLFFDFLDQAVAWAEELKLYLILDNHTFDSSRPTDPNIERALLKVWPQMAAHYRDRSAYILYEVLNEPHGIDLAKWAGIQGRVINAIRAVDQKHTIVVGAANWNTYNDLNSLPAYPDKNLIYTFHFYDPFIFTHQGASWTDLTPAAGVPFPPDAKRMPPVPAELRNSWVARTWNNYQREGSPETVKNLINIAVDFGRKRHVPIYCGEFGVYMLRSDPKDRVAWYKMVRECLESQNIAWTSWDYVGGFGIFTEESGGPFESSLNIPLLQAMGFNPPPQKPLLKTPETAAFNIFTDQPAPGILTDNYYSSGSTDFYDSDNPAAGKYSIHLAKPPRYSPVHFDFAVTKDLSQLVAQGYSLELKIRSKGLPSRLEIRWVNPGRAENELPWRCAAPLDIVADNTWRTVRIPLSQMAETGAWKQKWYPGEGKFDWSRIQSLEITTEFTDCSASDFWFGDFRVVK